MNDTDAQRVVFRSHGSPSVLEFESLTLKPLELGQVRVRNQAIGVNFIDTYFRSGLYAPPALPSGLGTEGAGTVVECAEDVQQFQPGDRVAYVQSTLGAYSTHHCLDQRHLVHLPDDISFTAAAGGLLKGLTTLCLFNQVSRPKSGDTVLFHAAAGGVGLLACQYARSKGVRLIGVVSNEAKAEQARSAGAWETVLTGENIAEKVRHLTGGKGARFVYDSVGRSTWRSSLDATASCGHLISFGNASGPVVNVALAELARAGSLTVSRPILFDYISDPAALQAAALEFFQWLREGLNVRVGATYALNEAEQAHLLLESRNTTGSIVLVP
ncbi:quinone oxidoreductase [Marinobacter sp. M3C]|jgi:NADPH2:quinone reductase|uniref:quinone oxidoreductase family protein n=1 Tax=Marinobacter sp. M3C TaxID=2917715 RepID=UPI00200D2C47|nr:quinone oxidoreductase [Marinobacter sp. M3C]MCL1476715.1 quinone oxidoreductase [Marinobacter sp.]UQG58672.1 quinone oxidoreductase [Marinobacter sp. M3C]